MAFLDLIILKSDDLLPLGEEPRKVSNLDGLIFPAVVCPRRSVKSAEQNKKSRTVTAINNSHRRSGNRREKNAAAFYITSWTRRVMTRNLRLNTSIEKTIIVVVFSAFQWRWFVDYYPIISAAAVIVKFCSTSSLPRRRGYYIITARVTEKSSIHHDDVLIVVHLVELLN